MTVNGTSASILVPVLNEEVHLERSVRAMLDQSFAGGVEVLIVDGRSTDATREIAGRLAREDPRVRLLDNPARRTPNALNIALAEAKGEYVVRMDAHTLYPRDYVARAVERLQAGGVEWVSGPQVPVGEGPWSRRVALALDTPMGMGGAAFRNATSEIEVDTGFTGVWLRETLVRHRGWDEAWPVNQDSELAARIRRSGGKIVCLPEMAARYVPRDSLRALARQYWRYGQYRAKTSGRHPQSMRRSHVLAPALALTAVAALAASRPLKGAARLGIGAYAAGLLAGTAHAARSTEGPLGDVAALPLVYATMHFAWGAGFIVGSARFGPPISAFARQLGLPKAGDQA
ncbi:MAG: glycosyltransferase family 2 protein [Actinomycetota bacterium]|nr:glycosyltransferase family 2 protein [Actinomycetota bacterium]